MHENILRKCPTLVNRRNVPHDNARPHSARITLEKILDFGWSVLFNPPYSPDFMPSDFHLFHSLQNALNDRKFSQDQVKILKLKTS